MGLSEGLETMWRARQGGGMGALHLSIFVVCAGTLSLLLKVQVLVKR